MWGRPQVCPNEDFTIKFTLYNKRRDQRHVNVALTLPEGWTADYRKCVHLDWLADSKNGGIKSSEITIHVGETVQNINRLTLTLTAPTHPLPLLVPITLLG